MKTLSPTLLLLFFSQVVIGQTMREISSKQIIDSSLIFCGGEKHLAKITSCNITYQFSAPDQSIAIINQQIKTGNKFVQSILSRAHPTHTTFFNGEKVSRVKGDSVFHSADPLLLEELKLKTFNQIQYGYKVLGYELTRLPDQKFKNFDCFVVDAKSPKGFKTTNFFDKTNFRLLMVVYPNGNKSLMINYVFKDSVLINSLIITTFVDSEEMQSQQLVKAELNAAISDTWFNCPYTDKVFLPDYIITGKFESITGAATIFERTKKSQDYLDEQGKVSLQRPLKWRSSDTFGLKNEMAKETEDPSKEILVRIISWDKQGYVCQWQAGIYTDTQEYKIIK